MGVWGSFGGVLGWFGVFRKRSELSGFCSGRFLLRQSDLFLFLSHRRFWLIFRIRSTYGRTTYGLTMDDEKLKKHETPLF